MQTFVDDNFITVSEENGILTLRFKKTTKEFTDDLFKEEALKFIQVVKERKSKKIIVDMRDFRFSLSDEVLEWRNDNIVSEYNKVGVEKFAFISEKPAVKQDDPENTFQTQTFTSEEEAIKWLLG